MKKILFVFAIVTALLAPTITNVSAHDTAHQHIITLDSLTPINHNHFENQIMPRAAYCGECGSMGLVLKSETKTTYISSRQVKCVHKKYGTDLMDKYYVQKIWHCSRCGDYPTIGTKEYLNKCGGYN